MRGVRMVGAWAWPLMMLAVGVAFGQGSAAPSAPAQDDAAGVQRTVDNAPGSGYEMEPGMTAPRMVQAVAAVYPEGVAVDGNSVRCLISLVVGEDGMPRYVHVVKSAGDAFDLAAVHAVRQSKYEAGLREQKTVPVRMLVRVVFTADGSGAVPSMLQRTYGGGAGGGDVDTRPKVIHSAEAEFSEEARRKKISGTVLLSLMITEEGMPADVTVVHGLGYGLDEKAVAAVRQYRFRPAMKDGKPVAQPIRIEVTFNTH